MNKGTAFRKFFSMTEKWRDKDSANPAANDDVLEKSEIFHIDQMEAHGKDLARLHQVKSGAGPDYLIERLIDNEHIIGRTCEGLMTALRDNRDVTPAAEWFLDNFYIIEEQIRISRLNLPKGYGNGLPKLLRGPSKHLPRIYDIALELIVHSDARLDQNLVLRFLKAYQSITPLQTNELWIFPIMLRLALIENVSRLAKKIDAIRLQRQKASFWADKMIEMAERDSTNLILVIADMAWSKPLLESAFVAEIARRLRGPDPALALPLNWIEQRLSLVGSSIEQFTNIEVERQSRDQLSLSNSIGSLRFLSTTNWRPLVEELSHVEHILRQDPGGIYPLMDFPTRDLYRHSIEKIAKSASIPELAVTQKALECVQRNKAGKEEPRASHIGFYLIGSGKAILEKALGIRPTLLTAALHLVRHPPISLYLGFIALLAALTGIKTALMAFDGHHFGGLFIFAAVLSILAATQFSVAVTNWLLTLAAEPGFLPRMDFSKGIPNEYRTLVVVPTFLTSATGIDGLCEALEVRFLSNAMKNIHFALLTDFTDAPNETMPEDDALLTRARESITALNKKYAVEEDIFFLLHRPRRWNAQEKIWMGYERKRGKLSALNALLRSGDKKKFSSICGNIEALRDTKYVLTLDTDTKLPRDAAYQLIGTMAHPLNRPYYDEKKQRVTRGYGILQPRVSNSILAPDTSLYARLWSTESGIDPYTRVVSDVYQDAFGEGSFVGKGIYEVEVFEKALDDKLPENRILSHDLLEGCYLRSGLISDVQLYEAYPSHYGADVSRRHRWTRGDWQIASWLLPAVPSRSRQRIKNPLSALSHWKIFDNLRRSLIPLILTVLLICGWSFFPSPTAWTLGVLGILFVPFIVSALFILAQKPAMIPWVQHLLFWASEQAPRLALISFNLAVLPYEAFYHLDAIVRACWRLHVSYTGLLEWKTSCEADQNESHSLIANFGSMWIAPTLALCLFILLSLYRPAALHAADVILALWVLSPAIAWKLSQPIPARQEKMSDGDVTYLRMLSRKIWSFFEFYVGPEDNWLPPDNVQELPVALVAHRTSPTNIGLALLANLTAWDFGYISTGTLIQRTEDTLNTMEKLERYDGHFLNWYNTVTLAPLHPSYVSTVDSGNLAGHLLTLRQGLLSIANQNVFDLRALDGCKDTLNLLIQGSGDKIPETLKVFENILKSGYETPVNPGAIGQLFEKMAREAIKFSDSLPVGTATDIIWWAAALARQCEDILTEYNALFSSPESKQSKIMPSLDQLAAQGSMLAKERIKALDRLAQICNEMSHMAYGFLYDADSRLLAIGYNVTDSRRDTSFYDLLASEARLATFVAIAQGQIPQESWFALGRKLARVRDRSLLMSWSGSMFEYLMPLLVMPSYKNTLLHATCKAAVASQIDYGLQKNDVWGISESGYYGFDVHLNYQYRAFGVPGLGFKRGLADDFVIAPYASIMALTIMPEKVPRNLLQLSKAGFESRFGFYEAIDYTVSRVPRGKSHAIVKSFMSHHQGMSLLSLASFLLQQPMQKRFEKAPLFQTTIPLLHEKAPKTAVEQPAEAKLSIVHAATKPEPRLRVFTTPNTISPEVQLLSNGRYHCMVTNAGGGYSRWKDLAVTRWRSDMTRDNWGSFCYIRDLKKRTFWSTGFQPTLKQPEFYEAVLPEGRAEFRRRDGDIETHTEIIVSPEDDVEVRRISISNRSHRRRPIEVTSYGEVVLATPAADMAHPAFSNLFVQTELLPQQQAILCTRRRRSAEENPPWMCHLMTVQGVKAEDASFETNRMVFIGRGNSTIAPQAMLYAGALSGSAGSVLDPIVSIRRRIIIEPGKTAIINIVTGMAEAREPCLALVNKYQDSNLVDRIFDLASSHSEVIVHQLNATEADAQTYSSLASLILYPNAAMRGDTTALIKNHRGQSGLWSYGISGDIPIVLLQIGSASNMDFVRQMIQAHAYWRLKGLPVDLLICHEGEGGYRQSLQDQIIGLISVSLEAHLIDRSGGIFVRHTDQIAPEDRILLESAACIVLHNGHNSLENHRRRTVKPPHIPLLIPAQAARAANDGLSQPESMLSNGFGGFGENGKEYVITTAPGQKTPAPWSNVLANHLFGSVISESGAAYTWHENAHEFRLTPWQNDPVTDASGEAFYLRDEQTGQVWSPAPEPVPAATSYITRHGFGYSVFECIKDGIHTELWIYVALDAAVKFSVLKVKNESGRTRKLSATGYVEWVLGDLRSKTCMHVVTEVDKTTGAVFARNGYNTDFPGQIAFFDVNDPHRYVTCDRSEFIGRNRSLRNPSAMEHAYLSGRAGAGLDPCTALQTFFTVADGEEKTIIFKLGIAGQEGDDICAFVRRLQNRGSAENALNAVRQYWDQTLGAVQVKTPDPATDMLANGWLMYQTIACRLWARSGYYQSGGAFGFRDQLQDAMAVVHTQPHMLRDQILLCTTHQFKEGDVQHWWHPPSDRGVRTKCSDDYLWLPLALCRYIETTGDKAVLDQKIPFIEGRLLRPEEESYYDMPVQSAETATLYEHCLRAIQNGLHFGVHGLPLIGSCDWNDGMDKIGAHGQGESVWLAFFLYDILNRFQKIAVLREDNETAELCQAEAVILKRNIEKNGWDGEWYRRAYFDNGTPLGSAINTECQIDSLSQSWAVLSNASTPEHAQKGMEAFYRRLVRREDALVLLFDPPFDKADPNPGYIRGYAPGVRENGGQYTHAAIWAAMAFAKMGDGNRAYELLEIINPLNHARTHTAAMRYRVEPYVVAADVYGVAPYTGRGGWTWYTGSAGWMYRLILESILGLHLENQKLTFEPHVPSGWESFSIDYKYKSALYKIHIRMVSSEEETGLYADGVLQKERFIQLIDSGRTHAVEIKIHRTQF